MNVISRSLLLDSSIFELDPSAVAVAVAVAAAAVPTLVPVGAPPPPSITVPLFQLSNVSPLMRNEWRCTGWGFAMAETSILSKRNSRACSPLRSGAVWDSFVPCLTCLKQIWGLQKLLVLIYFAFVLTGGAFLSALGVGEGVRAEGLCRKIHRKIFCFSEDRKLVKAGLKWMDWMVPRITEPGPIRCPTSCAAMNAAHKEVGEKGGPTVGTKLCKTRTWISMDGEKYICFWL